MLSKAPCDVKTKPREDLLCIHGEFHRLIVYTISLMSIFDYRFPETDLLR